MYMKIVLILLMNVSPELDINRQAPRYNPYHQSWNIGYRTLY